MFHRHHDETSPTLSPASRPRAALVDRLEHPLWAPEPPRQAIPPELAFAAGMRHHHIANTAYPIAHRRTIWPFRQPAERHDALIARSLAHAPRISLYAHIPFCERRCTYCEYAVVPEHDTTLEATYVDALLEEIDRYVALLGSGCHTLAGFDIGGGTPSLVQPHHIARIIDRVTRHFRQAPGFDISIETTPRIAAAHPERMAALRRLGIERISMGLQTVDPGLAARYGRDAHNLGDNAKAVDSIRAAGFSRFNVDLMYGFAGQSLDGVLATVDAATALAPEYVTLYRMRYKGTRVRGEMAQVDADTVGTMHEAAHERLVDAGFAARLGKNAFSRVAGDPGTSAYLTSRVVESVPYIGLGLGAQSFTNHLLAYNQGAASKRLDDYLSAVRGGQLPIQDLYHLPPSEGMAKMLSVSFYFGAIDLAAFRVRFGLPLHEAFPAEFAWVLSQGLMRHDGERLCLTRAGMHAVNGVIALFYSDRVKQHLLTR